MPVTSYDFRLPHHTTGLTVLFEPSEYTVSKGDTAVNVCLKKSVKISEELTVTVTAKESPPPSTKRRSRQGDCLPH